MNLRLVDLDTAIAAERQSAAIGHPGRHYISFDTFTMDGNGLWTEIRKGRGDQASVESIRISDAFEVLGRGRDPSGYGWAKQIRWLDPDGRAHEHAIPDAALHGDLGALAADLANRGLTIAQNGRKLLAEYLNRVDVEQRVTCVTHTGWHQISDTWCFVLPGEVIHAPHGETVILQSSATDLYEHRGSLDDWRQGIGRLASGHTRTVLAVSAAFAGPLLSLVDIEGGGLHLFGPSSCGKTTIERAAASVWGRGSADPGFMRSWRATANAQEAAAAQVTDTLLVLDEIGVADGKDVAAAVYQLPAGVGKRRSRRDGSAGTSKTWRVLVISTGEIPMASKITEDRGRRAYAGQSVRLLDIPADAGQGYGAFDHAGPESDAGRLAEAIKQAAASAYGTAGPEFVRQIIEGGVDHVRNLGKGMIADFSQANVPPEADGQVKRAAERLGLIGAAGELAREWGIVPWQVGEAMEAARRILDEWIAQRGGMRAAEEREAIAQVRRYIEAYGEARFEPLDEGTGNILDPDGLRVLNRVGWRKGFGPDQLWYVLPEMWKTEVCSGLDPTATARVLATHNMLRRDDAGRKFSRPERTPYGTKRVYVVTAGIFEEGSDGP
jgi:uncharacterized protein (DUF927 family)